MTEVISLRIAPKTLAELDRRAADTGIDRSKYLLRLVENDLSKPKAKTRRKFASAHLIGRFKSQGSTNREIRAAMKAQHDKNR